MNKKLIILFIVFYIFSCEKRYSQSELIEQNISMSEIDELAFETIINWITSYVIEKPGTVYRCAYLYKFPSDDSEPYYFY